MDSSASTLYRDNRQKMNEDQLKNIDKVVLKQENRSIICLDRWSEHIADDYKSYEVQSYNTLKDVTSLLSLLVLVE